MFQKCANFTFQSRINFFGIKILSKIKPAVVWQQLPLMTWVVFWKKLIWWSILVNNVFVNQHCFFYWCRNLILLCQLLKDIWWGFLSSSKEGRGKMIGSQKNAKRQRKRILTWCTVGESSGHSREQGPRWEKNQVSWWNLSEAK